MHQNSMLLIEDESAEAPAAGVIPLTFAGNKPRTEVFALDHHLRYGERVITTLEVHRMTVAQVEAFIHALATDSETSITAYMVTLSGGDPVPPEVFKGLDDDDDTRLFEVMQSFLPRRLQRVLAQSPFIGDAMSPSSQAD
ncbi:hypothetical protein [Microvirga sp. CF3016]|uniref:hypothetical protein n=1 Tax=Microvirga sp. CF3016 TaxID=3110181 RepID=UPI002E7A97CC|nr:hypothetical protein [Microvirga sp. CF3016]MEE1612069.1 hypothetical protein [Microvirga sp. CF3016]